MYKCKYWIFIAIFLTAFKVSAQSTKGSPLEQRKFQLGIQAGTINYGLNASFKLKEKLNLYLESGMALVYFFSLEHYSRFNKDYSNYNIKEDNFINLGGVYWAPYSEASLRFLFNQNSKIKYQSAPYANTFGYLAARFRFNSVQTSPPNNGEEKYRFRETYLLSAIVGRKLELERTSFSFLDISAGVSLTSNYKLAAFTAGGNVSLKLGFNVWNKNK